MFEGIAIRRPPARTAEGLSQETGESVKGTG